MRTAKNFFSYVDNFWFDANNALLKKATGWPCYDRTAPTPFSHASASISKVHWN
jgi:hypothetical protein